MAIQEVSFLIITEFFDTLLSMAKEWKDMLYRKFVIIIEGFSYSIHGMRYPTIPWKSKCSRKSSATCLKRMPRDSVSSYIDFSKHSDFTKFAVRNFKWAFQLLCCYCAVAFLVLTLERQLGSATKTYKKLRNRRRVDVVDNSDDTLASEVMR